MKNYLTTLGIALTFALPNAAHAQSVVPPPMPTKLQVEPPNEAFLVGHAIGTQNYECQPVDSLGRVGWVLFTPQATLFDDLGEQIITHFFSPSPSEDRIVRATWQDSQDSSIVWARAIESSLDPNFVKAGAIPWVLLVVGQGATQAGPTGGDTLTGTTFVQRLNTDGGAAPPTGCNLLPDVGHKAFVPYTADYFFYRR